MKVALAADTLSITVMEIVDNVVVVAVPGAMDAQLGSPLFWGTLAVAPGHRFIVAWPVNRWLISHDRGHTVLHQYHLEPRACECVPLDFRMIRSTRGPWLAM